MARVEILPLQGVQNTPQGPRTVRFARDIVRVTETFVDDNGEPFEHTYTAGYCDTPPGSPFLPIIQGGLPDAIMLEIKRVLAERDARATGKSVFDTYQRQVAAAPPMIGDLDDDEDSDA